MLPGRCHYIPGQVGEQAKSLAGAVQQFWTGAWEPLVRGGIDGYNISEALIDKRCGLEWEYAALGRDGPKKLCIPALSETQVPSMRRKGPAGSERKYGLEFVVDPRQPTGRVCFVAITDTSKQIGSAVVEDPATTATPYFRVQSGYGPLNLRAATVLDLQHSDGTTRVKIDASGNTQFKGVQGTVNTLARFDSTGAPVASGVTEVGGTVKADALVVDFADAASVRTAITRRGHSAIAASDGGSTTWTTLDPIHTLFVDANALTTSHTITLPDPASPRGREVSVKITIAGAGTLDIASAGGANVEGSTYSMDASARSTATFRSDDTNWWRVA